MKSWLGLVGVYSDILPGLGHRVGSLESHYDR